MTWYKAILTDCAKVFVEVGRMIFLCKKHDVPLNGVRRVGLRQHPAVAVYNLDGSFHATDDRCTHGEASLAKGEVDGGQIICPLHYGSFDIVTGEPTESPCTRPLAVYRVVQEGDDLFLAGAASA